MTIWSNNSKESLNLKNKLREKGYNLEEVLTAATEPTVSDQGFYVFGYWNIYMRYDLLSD